MRQFFSLLALVMFASCSACADEPATATMTPAQISENYSRSVVLIVGLEADKSTTVFGTGFLVSASGVFVTNYHVVQGVYPAQVKLANGDVYDSLSVVDTDERKDIAVLKIKGFNLPTVPLGDSDGVAVGSKVVVIGNPQGLQGSVTDGLVSAIRDTGEGYKMFQISAAISPGSSGSPVFDERGHAIGIATSSFRGGQNLNFAVPINYVRGLVSEKEKMTLEEFSSARLHPPGVTTGPSLTSKPGATTGPSLSSKLHPCVDAALLITTDNEIASLRQQMRAGMRSHRTDMDVLQPWTRPVPGLAESWAVCMTPTARLAGTVYNAEKLHFSDEETRKTVCAAQGEASDSLRFIVRLCKKGTGSGLWPYKAGPGDKEFLEEVRFVVAVDDVRHLQPVRPADVKTSEHESKFWAGLVAGGMRKKVDYYATFTLDFPLKGTNGEALIGLETKTLKLLVIGPKEELAVPFSLVDFPGPH